MKAFFDHAEPEAENIRTFHFLPERPVRYTAGQFVELGLPHTPAAVRGARREFTLSSSPTEESLAITTRFVPGKSSSFKQALFSLEPGTAVNMTEPMGDFVLPKLAQVPLVFVAAGMGITPFRSMFKWLADTGEQRDIKFMYGVRSEEEIVFQQDMEDAGVHATIVVSEPSPAWGGERGRLTAEMITGLAKPTEDTLIYLSGPEPMIEALPGDLKKQGIKEEQLVTDYFPGYTSF